MGFDQALDSARALVDALELGAPGPILAQDPTYSSLFQAHSGSLSATQGQGVSTDPLLATDRFAQPRVTGVDASEAASPFTHGQPPSTGIVPPGSESAELTRPPASAGEFGDAYEVQLDGIRPIGTHLDLRI